MFIILSTRSKIHHFSSENCHFTAVTIVTIANVCNCNYRRIMCTKGIFYVRRIGFYLYKYRIYCTISIHLLKSLAYVYQLI